MRSLLTKPDAQRLPGIFSIVSSYKYSYLLLPPIGSLNGGDITSVGYMPIFYARCESR